MSSDSEGGRELSSASVFDSDVENVCRVVTSSPGPKGSLPVTAEDLMRRPSGDLFGWTQDVGMGWDPARLRRPEVLILSTQGGIRLPDGKPLALGYYTGHWEVGLLMQAAAEELREQGCIPLAGYSQTYVTAGRKGRRACSIASPTVTTRRLCCADSSARCLRDRRSSVWRRATRGYRQ